MRKNERGFGLIEFMMLVAIILICAAVIVPTILRDVRDSNFNKYFGLSPSRSWEEDEAARRIAQPLVSKKIGELKARADADCGEYDVVSNSPTEATPESANARLSVLDATRDNCKRATENLRRATNAAKDFGFKTD